MFTSLPRRSRSLTSSIRGMRPARPRRRDRGPVINGGLRLSVRGRSGRRRLKPQPPRPAGDGQGQALGDQRGPGDAGLLAGAVGGQHLGLDVGRARPGSRRGPGAGTRARCFQNTPDALAASAGPRRPRAGSAARRRRARCMPMARTAAGAALALLARRGAARPARRPAARRRRRCAASASEASGSTPRKSLEVVGRADRRRCPGRGRGPAARSPGARRRARGAGGATKRSSASAVSARPCPWPGPRG